MTRIDTPAESTRSPVIGLSPAEQGAIWARRGIAAFPIEISWDEAKRATNKKPLTRNGHRNASSDPDEVRRMFEEHQQRVGRGHVMAVGLLPGPSGIVVLDPDIKGGGDGPAYARSIGAIGGWTVDTASGGQHLYFAKPDPRVQYSNAVPREWVGLIDVRSDNGWVVAPGTTTQWGSWTPVVDWPDELPRLPESVDILLRNSQCSQSSSPSRSYRNYSPSHDDALLHPRTVEVHQLLVDKFGLDASHTVMKFHADSTAGTSFPFLHVTRPGKQGGTSAGIGWNAPDTVTVFTSGWPDLPAGSYGLRELLEMDSGGATADGWAEPNPLVVGSRAPFPVDALPDGMAAAVAEVADSLRVDHALPATAFLGVAAGAVGAITEVVITPTWRRKANLYLAVVALSGDGKTPATQPALEPLRTLEREAVARAEEERRVASVMLPIHRRALESLQKSAPSNAIEMATLQAEIDKAEAYCRRQVRMLVDDVTPESLSLLMADNDGRMIAVNDEGSLIRHMLGMYNKSPNLDPFLKGWDGNPFMVDRKGGGDRGPTSISVTEPLLTLVAAIQPTTLREIGTPAHRDLVERGVVGRVMIAWPQSTAGSRLMASRVHAPYSFVDPWNARVLEEARRGPQMIAFTESSRAAFLSWHDTVEKDLPLGRLLADVREFAVKCRDSVARIAGLFARLDGATTVDEEHVLRAILIGQYYLDNAQAVVESWSTEPVEVARRLESKLATIAARSSDGRNLFSVRDACRAVRGSTTETVLSALELLLLHGYVRPVDPVTGFGAAGRGMGKKSPLVEVNPHCL